MVHHCANVIGTLARQWLPGFVRHTLTQTRLPKTSKSFTALLQCQHARQAKHIETKEQACGCAVHTLAYLTSGDDEVSSGLREED